MFQAHGIASCKGRKARACLMYLRNSREEIGLEQSERGGEGEVEEQVRGRWHWQVRQNGALKIAGRTGFDLQLPDRFEQEEI